MGPGIIGIESFQIGGQFLGENLSFMLGKSQDFVAAEFDCACFMHGNMAGLGGDDPLERFQQSVDDGAVGLCSAREEKDVGFRAGNSFADTLFCGCAERIFPVAGLLDEIGFGKALQNLRVRALGIIASE